MIYFKEIIIYIFFMLKFDLHMHSTFSDGEKTPEELVRMAVDNGITTLAITDHDIVEGICIAAAEAKKHLIEIIPGVEVNCVHNTMRMEILGYFIDPANRKLNERLAQMREYREKRADQMIEKLKGINFDISRDRVAEISGTGTIGRPHIARALLEKGYVSSIGEAFRKYLSDNGPCYVSRMKIEAADAIALIRNAGGIPVHSHPGFYKTNDLRQHMIELKKLGLMGVEVFYPYPFQVPLFRNNGEKVSGADYERYLLSIARELEFVVTGGTDYHGGGNYSLTITRISADYEYIEKLKETHQQVSASPTI
ncbi:MAG: PHP domain-containing protein [Candidatus Schekmanbacteria bacterium]|nr:PHP domain-containing protein [Candidatus Schekmanbacteria bacterium]